MTRRRMIDAWAAWMTGCILFPLCESVPTWAFFWTFDFLEEVSARSAYAALKRWLRLLASQEAGVNDHVRFVYCLERQQRGVIHFHLLHDLPPGAPFEAPTFARLWRTLHRNAGNAVGLPFDWERELDVASYIAKDGEVDANVACPRSERGCKRTRRGRSCLWSPGPW